MPDTATTVVAEGALEPLHIRDADFRKLPRSVRMLLLTYSRPAASAEKGLMVLEIRGYRWPEIDSEIKRSASHAKNGTGKLRRLTRYANDYECQKDGAAWSRIGCRFPRSECCPVCRAKVKPTTSEKYTVIELD